MPVRKPFLWRGLIDMSFNKYNLFNSYRYARQGPEKDLNKTAFQLRWRAKQLAMAYHSGHLSQKQFRNNQAKIRAQGIHAAAVKSNAVLPVPPATMLNFAFIERRLDTAIFRALFVQSIWESRSIVRKGQVFVNGQRVRLPSYVLEDGDIVQVNPGKLKLTDPKKTFEWEKVEKEIMARQTNASNNEKKVDEEYDEEYEEDEEEEDEEEVNEESEKSQSVKLNRGISSIYPKEDLGFFPAPFMAPWMFVPEYLEVNYNNLSFCFLRSPTIKPGRCEIPSPYDELVHQRSFDFYTKYRKLK